ncbi:TIGR04372 family glycosyltransferase [Maridesulfovibrio hydrothermalis]|uniref:Uncharacterized protein n=1 Tax=Maridesulfovibrio hydrothermalis AM13 = DSM 14728 TaxID=1121451 RepID=L0R9Y4_9BACT|nr:TIGR04372 family glycosyltransferase [Maridesulfovibrio hydrothermalis]CCO23593.1 conserved protein of unknown function [Maridesulfovibrio hydrothermalis AM13 = DSM 14728]
MKKKKRVLIIGTAPQYLISEFISQVDRSKTYIHLLVPERDINVYPQEDVSYFSGNFHPFFRPLLKSMITFRPDEVVVVCGMTYDHDNVVNAVLYYTNFKKMNIKIAVRNQLEDLKGSTRPALLKEFLKWAGLAALALLIKVLSPVITIRAGEIFSSRLGHLAMESEIYLCEAELGRHSKCLDLFYFKDNEISNATLARMISQKMHINRKFKYVLDAVRRFNMAGRHEVLLNTRKMAFVRDSECIIQQTDNHFKISQEQEQKGLNGLKELGLSPQHPRVCIFGRDSVYLRGAVPTYNDEDMQKVRNMDIETFTPAVKYLLDKEYNVLRMGSIVKKPLLIDHPNYIDYACSGKRSDFMDIYLGATCRFFVGIQSGLIHIPMIFRIPCLSLNVVRPEIIHFCSPEDLAIFKLMRSKSENRILKISEIIETGISRWRVEEFADSDIELIDNTEDEILEAVKEMQSRVQGTWSSTKEDRELLHKFHSCFNVSKYNSKYVTPISSYFLKKHAHEIL